MVVDCGDTPAAAEALLEDLGASTGRPATLLRRQAWLTLHAEGALALAASASGALVAAGVTPRLIGLTRDGGTAVFTCCLDEGAIAPARRALDALPGARLHLEPGFVVLTCWGRRVPERLGRVLGALADAGVSVQAVATSASHLQLAFPEASLARARSVLADEAFSDVPPFDHEDALVDHASPSLVPDLASLAADARVPLAPQQHVVPGPASAPYLARQAERESNARTYPRKIQLAITEAKGLFVKDADGQVYYDCLAGAGTLALGHNHPAVVEAVKQAMDSGLPMHTLDITTPVKDAFTTALFETLPADFARRARIQFCGPSGSDAVEAAIKLVKTATGRRGFMSFHGGYHGMTHGALALMGNLGPKLAVPNLMADVQFMPYPYPYRCPLGLGGEAAERALAHYVGTTLADPEAGVIPPAGMILEAVQGEGGVIPAPTAWLQEVRRHTESHGVPLILDEVQTGFGRTGRMFGFEHAGIRPDVVVLSKALGGGLPIAVVVYDESLDQWQPGAHAGTFRGNQLAMAAGLAVMKTIREDGLVAHAQAMGERFLARLGQIQAGTRAIGELRGRGLMLGIEIVDPTADADALGARPAHPTLARRLQAECLKRGLILELGGRFGTVVRLLPPLVITAEQVDAVCDIFADALEAAERAEVSTLEVAR